MGARANNALRNQLLAAWAEPHRSYHTLEHLAECLEVLAYSTAPADPPAEVEVALWFHDAIYDVHSHDNELRSASWAQQELRAHGAAPAAAERVYQLVMATQHAAQPQTPDGQLLVDVDLSILGAPPARFAAYEAQIRQEYAWVPDDVFRTKRGEILRGFLARPTLYSTAYFRTTREAAARNNLQQALAGL